MGFSLGAGPAPGYMVLGRRSVGVSDCIPVIGALAGVYNRPVPAARPAVRIVSNVEPVVDLLHRMRTR